MMWSITLLLCHYASQQFTCPLGFISSNFWHHSLHYWWYISMVLCTSPLWLTAKTINIATKTVRKYNCGCWCCGCWCRYNCPVPTFLSREKTKSRYLKFKNTIIHWNIPWVLENNFLGLKECYLVKTWRWESSFWGSEILVQIREGFHEVAGEACRWWSHFPFPAGAAFFEQVIYLSPAFNEWKHVQTFTKIWHHLSSGSAQGIYRRIFVFIVKLKFNVIFIFLYIYICMSIASCFRL